MTTRHTLIIITQGEEGGAQQFVRHLTTNAEPSRFRFTVAWGGVAGDFLARTLPHSVDRIFLKHLVRSAWAPIQDLLAVRELRQIVRRTRPDTLLLISSKAGFIGSRAARGLKKAFPHLKVIYRIGGWAFNDPRPGWERALYRAIEKRSARWKDTIVVNSAHDLQQAHRLGIKPLSGIVSIPNGIDPYVPLVSREEALAELERHIDGPHQRPYSFLVGTVANFYPAKDLANLIRVASHVSSEVRFLVIGDGPLRPELERLIATERIRDRFFLLGRIRGASRLLSAFDAFILPSSKEGFPWALLEAMAAKIPVIATRVGAVPEMIEDGVSGIICAPGDAASMVRAIARLRDDERIRRELAIAAHQQVISKFSLHHMISEFEKLLS